MFGIGLEQTLTGYLDGGTGYIEINYKDGSNKMVYTGSTRRESEKLHCYYMTNSHYGSDFKANM